MNGCLLPISAPTSRRHRIALSHLLASLLGCWWSGARRCSTTGGRRFDLNHSRRSSSSLSGSVCVPAHVVAGGQDKRRRHAAPLIRLSAHWFSRHAEPYPVRRESINRMILQPISRAVRRPHPLSDTLRHIHRLRRSRHRFSCEFVEIIGPGLHHRPSLREMFGMVVGCSN
jgi:hypothetical protein